MPIGRQEKGGVPAGPLLTAEGHGDLTETARRSLVLCHPRKKVTEGGEQAWAGQGLKEAGRSYF